MSVQSLGPYGEQVNRQKEGRTCRGPEIHLNLLQALGTTVAGQRE